MKVGLVLEGGAMRGLWTAGVLDVLMDNNIDVDGIIGTSAGGLFGVNFFSKQKGRAIRYNMRYAKDYRYMSILSLIFTGNVINKRFAFYKVSKELDVFDNDTFIKNNKEFYVSATNVETGQPTYFKINNPIEDLEKLRATSAIPFVSRFVKIDGKKYLDGGISDSIPIEKMISLGYDRIIVVLTRPIDYVKKPIKLHKMLRFKYRKYPLLLDKMKNRYKEYNKTLELIKKLEQDNKIFVIRPNSNLDIRVIERNKEKMRKIYDLGISDCNKSLNDLKKYLQLKGNDH